MGTKKKKLSDFWTQALSSTLGTIIGIIVTFGTTAWLEHREQQAMERTETLMVIHNLDSFCDNLKSSIEDLNAADSLNNIVWKHSPDRLDQLPDSTLQLFLSNLLLRNASITDQTTESIFSNNIDTWKSISNTEFVVHAGGCFSAKHMVTKMRDELDGDKRYVYNKFVTTTMYCENPAQTLREAVARVFKDPELCCFIKKQHEYYLGGMQMGLKMLQEHNAINKKLMNVTDEELRQFGGNSSKKAYTYTTSQP